jgi:hypothetical protein
MMLSNQSEVVFSFDTTGSMYPALTQARRNIKESVTKLHKEIPGIRIGVVAHGDYCDAGYTYTIKMLDLTTDVNAIVRFVENAGSTGGGGNGGEAYELVMHEVQKFSWTPGYNKALVMIGDEPPHLPHYYENTKRLDWAAECKKLALMGIPIYAVQALNRYESTNYWRQFAELTGGYHLQLDQFSYVTDMLLSICYKQSGDEMLQAYEKEVIASNRMNRNLDMMFSTLLSGRAPATTGYGTPTTARNSVVSTRKSLFSTPADLLAVAPGRFQVLMVDHDMDIKSFCNDQGVTFKRGRGFYEFMKAETIQDHKEIVLMDRHSGDLYSGKAARDMLRLPEHGSVKIKPADLKQYRIFVQSTSNNRKLIGGYSFLYEVDHH